jgi:hypothetical protein
MKKPTQNPNPQASEFANEADVGEQDEVNLEGITAHEDNGGAESEFVGIDDIRQPVGATPKSAVTARHDEGSRANETVDGLSETEELTRRLTEDLPTGTGAGADDEDEEDVPVFERGRTKTGI